MMGGGGQPQYFEGWSLQRRDRAYTWPEPVSVVMWVVAGDAVMCACSDGAWGLAASVSPCHSVATVVPPA